MGPDFTFLQPPQATRPVASRGEQNEHRPNGVDDQSAALRRRCSDKGPGPDLPPLRGRVFFRRQTDDSATVLTTFNRWWDRLCSRHGLDPRQPVLEETGYHAIQLIKSAMQRSDQVGAAALYRQRDVVVVVADDGEGLGSSVDEVIAGYARSRDLIDSLMFADSFVVASSGWELSKNRQGTVTFKAVGKPGPGTRVEIAKRLPVRGKGPAPSSGTADLED